MVVEDKALTGTSSLVCDSMTPKEPTVNLGLPNGDSDHDRASQDAIGGLFLRWSHLSKTVEVKDMSAGGLAGRSSLAQKGAAADAVAAQATGGATSNTMTKTILHSVSGYAAPGQVLACMGPSGSGKTSLMNVLSGRSIFQHGSLSINDVELATKRDMKKFLQPQVAYVKQSDVFFNHLTVRDQLTYTALLRLPANISLADKHKEVDSILQQLRLGKVADSPIQMVSGGERKRVNIGSELLTNPKLVLLDEPTSESCQVVEPIVSFSWKLTIFLTVS